MIPLVTAELMKGVEEKTIRKVGLSELLLMEHAALGALQSLEKKFSGVLHQTRGVIFAGPGNNGGDALALARLLHLKGVQEFEVICLGQKRSKTCEAQRNMLSALGVRWVRKPSRREFHWIIDGIFGTGLTRKLENEFLESVEWINSQSNNHFVLSLDIPSGLHSDTGRALGNAVHAHETVTFGFAKVGLTTSDAADYVGTLTISELPIPNAFLKGVDTFLIEKNDLAIPDRAPTSHKGTHGHVAVFLGIAEKEGASQLSALAALRSGCGLVTLFATADNLKTFRNRLCVEIMVGTFNSSVIDDKTWIVGPGYGVSESHWPNLETLLKTSAPLVLDGDALTLISQNQKAATTLLRKRKAPTILTPHPKEAARLLGVSVDEIQSDRIAHARKISTLYNATCLLKGKGSVIVSPSDKHHYIVDKGTPALAKGGSGDVLAGVVGALLSQGLSAKEAAITGAYWHGRTGELITQKKGESFSAMATEIADIIPEAIAESISK